MKEKYFYYEQDEFFDELLTSRGNPRNPAKSWHNKFSGLKRLC